MKQILSAIILTVVLTSTVQAEIICEKKGRFWYPKNDKAIKIAKMLNVKTCNGKRFKEVVAQLNEKSNVTTTKKHSVADVVKAMK